MRRSRNGRAICDRDTRLFAAAERLRSRLRCIHYTGPALPVRSSEALLQATYQAQIIPGWTIQPDFQYVIRPSGGIPTTRDPNWDRDQERRHLRHPPSTMRFATGGSAPETPRKEEPLASAPVSGFNWEWLLRRPANAGYGTAGRNRDDICGTGTFGFPRLPERQRPLGAVGVERRPRAVTPAAGRLRPDGLRLRRPPQPQRLRRRRPDRLQLSAQPGQRLGIRHRGRRRTHLLQPSPSRHRFRSPGGRVFTAAPNVTAPNVTASQKRHGPERHGRGHHRPASVQVLGPTPGVGYPADPIEGSAGNVALFNANPRGFDHSRIDWFATVRGRLGYAFDRVLIYGTGGIAYAGRPDSPNRCPNVQCVWPGDAGDRGRPGARRHRLLRVGGC